jgi:hypothetical protein
VPVGAAGVAMAGAEAAGAAGAVASAPITEFVPEIRQSKMPPINNFVFIFQFVFGGVGDRLFPASSNKKPGI